jgi:hypothetical protein
MKKTSVALVVAAGLVTAGAVSYSLFADDLAAAPLTQLPVGRPAPEFRLNAADGRQIALADHRGKTVVLEWSNPECPSVIKHYDSGNMQKTQAQAGTLVYNGAIDDKPTQDAGDIPGARNHVLAALAELRAGKPVSVPSSRPYGCSVKYG